MNVTSAAASIWQTTAVGGNGTSAADALNAAVKNGAGEEKADQEVRDAFQSFVGQTLFGQMLKQARKTVNKPAYFHGGRAEEMFQQQLDQVLAEKIADSEGGKYCDAMYELFTMKRG